MNIMWCLIAVCAGIAVPAHSRDADDGLAVRNIILPQRRVILPADRAVRQAVGMEKVNARVLVNGRSAVTTLELNVRNDGSSPAEAELLLPVPEGVVVKGFYYGDGKTAWQASLMPAAEARRLYDRIVARRKDPALLEFASYGAIRTSVFPVPPRSSVKLGMVYEQLLAPTDHRLDYVLPRTEALSGGAPWTVRVELAPGKGAPGNVFTPSHQMKRHELEDGTVVLTLAEERMSPGPFRLSWLEARGKKGEAHAAPDTSIYASPDAEGGKNGYFLAMVGKDGTPGANSILREVTLVLDRSGSMRGEKLASMKEAAKQIVSGLNPGERFNIITYNEGVNLFEAAPVEKSGESEKAAHAWLDAVVARGGTNVHEALAAALAQPSHEGMLPVVLFLTDGLPTIGRTSEKDIVALAGERNKAERRIFTIGVGEDVNAPLLRRMAEISGGLPSYVLSGEDLEVKLGQVFRQLYGPVFRKVRYTVCSPDGREQPGRVQDAIPSGTLPDIYSGAPAVLAGRYIGTEPFLVKGTCVDRNNTEWTFSITVDPQRIASMKDDFVARLWAARKIGSLETALMDMGEDSSGTGELRNYPETLELTEEIMRLSRDFGIMSSATAFFADDGSSGSWHVPGTSPLGGQMGRVMQESREGMDAISLQENAVAKKKELTLNKYNIQLDRRGRAVSFLHTAQIAQNGYFNRNGVWMENTVLSRPDRGRAVRTVQVGTPEYAAVADKLVKTNRQGLLALDGSVMLLLDGETVLMQNSFP